MGNIFSEISKGMDTQNTPEFQTLLNQRVASELTRFHEVIFATIMEDSNEELKDTLKADLTDERRITLEETKDRKILRADILTKDNKRVFFLDMGTNKEEGIEQITEETYAKLEEYVQDPLLVMQNVKEELADSAI